jgi:hypothetical protein
MCGQTDEVAVDALVVEPGALDREMPPPLAGVAKDTGLVQELLMMIGRIAFGLEIAPAAGKGDSIVFADHLEYTP